MDRILTCPSCKQRTKYSSKNTYRPFCSARCRLLDLGSWADESHRIGGDTNQDDLMSEEINPDQLGQ